MDMQLKKMPELKIVGLSVKTKNPQEFPKLCPQLWGKVCARENDVKKSENFSLAACFTHKNAEGMEFEYLAGYPVADFAVQPKDMLARTIPAYEYAVFTHCGDVMELHKTYDYIYSEGLKKHQLQPVDGFDMEYYGEDFNESPSSKVYIYVAVKKL